MRTRPPIDRSKPLPPHFVIYDYDNPSPAFSADDIAYIESIRRDFNAEDLARIHKLEPWVLNTNTGWLNSVGIPGLRPKPTNGHRYVKRFSADRFEPMIETFLSRVPEDFPPRGSGCNMPGLRVMLPNGDKYYPIVFHGDLAKWIERLDGAASFFHTALGQFDHGKFVVSDGAIYPFSSIDVEELLVTPAPKDW